MTVAETDGTAFWRFSLALYGAEGVPAACLDLQDAHGADVNVMLYLLFRAQGGRVLTAEEVARLDAEIEPWRGEVVRPLRDVRRALKAPRVSGGTAEADELRQRIKAVELRAEQLQQMRLAALGADLPGAPGAPAQALATYAGHLGTRFPAAATEVLLARLSDAAGS